MNDKDYSYDVFISYRWISPDQEWVRDQLHPALLNAGLKVCLDVEDFDPGRDLILEMGRAGLESRRVICVLSPEYFEEGRFVWFENLAARRRDPSGTRSFLIPLIFRKTEIPIHISGLIPIDWTDPKHHLREWKKLLRVLGAKMSAAPPSSSTVLRPQIEQSFWDTIVSVIRNRIKYAVLALLIIAGLSWLLIRWIERRQKVVFLESGFYQDAYVDGKWVSYDPAKQPKQRFWIGGRIKAQRTGRIETVVIASKTFDRFFVDYSPQREVDHYQMSEDAQGWVSIVVEVPEWERTLKEIKLNPRFQLLDSNGKTLGSFDVPAFSLPVRETEASPQPVKSFELTFDVSSGTMICKFRFTLESGDLRLQIPKLNGVFSLGASDPDLRDPNAKFVVFNEQDVACTQSRDGLEPTNVTFPWILMKNTLSAVDCSGSFKIGEISKEVFTSTGEHLLTVDLVSGTDESYLMKWCFFMSVKDIDDLFNSAQTQTLIFHSSC